MKKITMYECEHCGQVFGSGETHDEAVCRVKQITQAQEEEQELFMSRVYLQDTSEGPLGEWRTTTDYKRVEPEEVNCEALKFDCDGEVTEFRVFEGVRGAVEIYYTKIQPVEEGEPVSYHVQFDIHKMVLGEDEKLDSKYIEFLLRKHFDVDADRRNMSDCQVDHVIVSRI